MASDERTVDELRGKYKNALIGSPFTDELLRQMVEGGQLAGTYYESSDTLLISEQAFVESVVAAKEHFDRELNLHQRWVASALRDPQSMRQLPEDAEGEDESDGLA